ncbi:hypothetical protein [Martelella mangrovi]|uniref:Uncharacterized protein n=1 Tax=Martelella mangrovi TaxID=1397477 RepID=A0ABV2IFK3_9HYPH
MVPGFPHPAGATTGMALCDCGNIKADAMGLIGLGRVLSRDPADSYEIDQGGSQNLEHFPD